MMSKHVMLILLALVFTGKIMSQQKVYKLLDKTPFANINHHLLDAIDTARPRFPLMDNAFKPQKGRFIVYRFIATFVGTSFTNKQKEFHDVLIVKTNKQNKIIDAYQYTLEWADVPDADLYESTCKERYLTDNMPIGDFIFKRHWYYDKTELKETGVIKFE